MIYHLKNKIVRLNHLLPFIIFFEVLIPCSSEACTLKIPRQSKFKISSTGQCRFSIENNKKYFDLAYYKATNQGFDNLIREGVDIAASNGDLYLPMEFIQDANYGIEQLSPPHHEEQFFIPVTPRVNFNDLCDVNTKKAIHGRSDIFLETEMSRSSRRRRKNVIYDQILPTIVKENRSRVDRL